MLRCYVVDPDTGDPVEYTSYLRADKMFEVGGRAYDGQADQGTVILDDPDGELDWLVALAAGRVIYFTEDASGAELVVASGRIASKAVERGMFAADKGREFTITIEDRNSDLRNIIVHGWERPRESGRDRVLALIDAYLSGLSSTALNPNSDPWGRESTDVAATYVPDSMNQWMAAQTYDESDPLSVLRECAETEGKRFFIYVETDGTLALYYAPVTETAQLNSTVSVSTVIADVNGTTCFEPIWNAGPAFNSNGQETISGALLIHPDGSTTYERRDAPNIVTGALDIEERHDRREQTVHTQGSSADGVDELHAYLNFRDQEERRRQFSLDIPDDRIHLVKAGMRIEVLLAYAGVIPAPEFFRIGQTRIRWVGPSANTDNHYNVIVTLEYPVKLLRRWGPENPGPQPPPECAPDTPGSTLVFWSFTTDEFDDGTGLIDSGLLRASVPGPDCPLGVPCGYNTASNRFSDHLPVTAGTSYTVDLDVQWKYDPSFGRDIKILWFASGGGGISNDIIVAGAGHATNVPYHVGTTVTAPALATSCQLDFSQFAGIFVDNVMFGTAGTPAENDPFCVVDPGESPYFVPSDDPRLTADDQHLTTRLTGRHLNSSAITLTGGMVVVADLTDEAAVTTTVVDGYTAGMVGIVLEGGAVGAEVIVGWMGHFGGVNAGAVAVGDTIKTTTVAGSATSDTGRVEGAVGRVLAVDDNDEATYLEWWGIPDSATGGGGTGFVTNIDGGKEVIQSHGSMGATETIDLTNGNWHIGTLNANCTFTFTGATNGVGCSFRLRLHQDATGSRTVTWPGSVVWPAATAPTLSTAANAVDLLSFESNDGGTIWYGSYDRVGSGSSASLPWYVVTDAPYNAVGDNSNDDTAEIQAAIDAAEAAGGGIVYFPKGTYKITNALTVQGQLILRGEGKWASIIRQNTANTSGFSCNNAADLATFEHLQVLGPTGNSSGAAILTTKALNLYSIRTEGFYNGLTLGSGSFYSKAYECFFYNADNACVFLTGGGNNSAFFGCYAASGSANVYLEGNEQFAWYGGSSEAASSYGFLIDSSAGSGAGSGNETGGWIISGTYFENSATDIRIGSTANVVFAGTVQSCKFTSGPTWHIDGGYLNGLNLAGNYFLGGKDKVRVNATNGSNVLLGNNYGASAYGTMPASTVSTEAGDTRTPVNVGSANAAGSGPELAFRQHVHGGALGTGTSFPGSPATSARFFRTDRNLVYIYDGTRWVTEILFRETPTNQMGAFPITTSPVVVAAMPMWHTDYDIYVEAMYSSIYVATTNDGTKYWTVDLNKRVANDTPTSLGSFNTSAYTVNNNVTGKLAVGAVVTQGTNKVLGVTLTKTSTPGGIYPNFSIAYRLVG